MTNVPVVNQNPITPTIRSGLHGHTHDVLVTNPAGPSGEAYLYDGYYVLSPGSVPYYCDSDSDTFKSSSIDGVCTGSGCQPSGCTTTAGNDCNDNDPAINPDTSWYQDNDKDGFGNSSISLQQCEEPRFLINYVLDSNDYNDNDPYTRAPIHVSGVAIPYYAPYLSLQAAYDAASDGDIIQVIAVPFFENLFVDRDIFLTLECGYDGSFSSNFGDTKTTLIGDMTISEGTLTLENLVIE